MNEASSGESVCGDCIDEQLHRACKKKTDAKFDDLFYQNQPLADDREYARQPPNFGTCEEFIQYIENLGKKGAAINRRYSGQDFQRMFNEYLQHDVNQPDPLRSFQAREAARLGLVGENGDEETRPKGQKGKGKKTGTGKGKQLVRRITTGKQGGKQNTARLCEDCEQNVAEIYCGNCTKMDGTSGVLLCLACTDYNHRGALRGGHDCKDISEAPKARREPQEYCPHPYKAPFAIILAMTRALFENQQKLSLDEDEIKLRAQPLTDTDLYDKQAGKVMGGFDCIENTLLPKNLLQKEASGRHTFALTQSGTELGRKLDVYDQALQRFLQDSGVPRLPLRLHTQVATQRLCLVVDEHERDLTRLRSLADIAGINIIVRKLPVADYVWVLAPELDAGHVRYDGSHPEMEILLPVFVERKSWIDYHDTVRFGRWETQIRKMKACGVLYNFILIEGCVNDLRNVTDERKEKLQMDLEQLSMESGFYISRTSCWSKSSTWLFWLTHQLAAAYTQGRFAGEVIFFSQLQSRLTQGMREMRAGRMVRPVNPSGPCLVWNAEELVTAIFRDSLGEKPFEVTCREVFAASNHQRELLIVKDLDVFNKDRHTLLYNCLRLVSTTLPVTKESVAGVIEEQLMANIKGLVHYDVIAYWLLFLQINFGVYVMRAESDEDVDRLQEWFSFGRPGGDNPGMPAQDPSVTAPSPDRLQPQTVATATRPTQHTDEDLDPPAVPLPIIPSSLEDDDFAVDSQAEERMMQEALSLSLISSLSHDEVDGSTTLSSEPRPSTSHNPPSPVASSSRVDNLDVGSHSKAAFSPPPCTPSGRRSPLTSPVGASMDDAIFIDSQDSQQDDSLVPTLVDLEEFGNGDSIETDQLNPYHIRSEDLVAGGETQQGLSLRKLITPDRHNLTGASFDVNENKIPNRVSTLNTASFPITDFRKAPDAPNSQQGTESLSILDSHSADAGVTSDFPIVSPNRKRTTLSDPGAAANASAVIPEKKQRKQIETDEEMARRLQEELNSASSEGVDESVLISDLSSGSPQRSLEDSSPVFVEVGDHDNVDVAHEESAVLDDEALARKLQLEEEESAQQKADRITAEKSTPPMKTDRAFLPSAAAELHTKSDVCIEDDEALARILQQQLEEEEMEIKMSDKAGTVIDDEELARKLQEEEEMKVKAASGSNVSFTDDKLPRKQPARKTPAKRVTAEKNKTLASPGELLSLNDNALAKKLQEEEEMEAGGCICKSNTAVSSKTSLSQTAKNEPLTEWERRVQDEEIARKLQAEEELAIKHEQLLGRSPRTRTSQKASPPDSLGSQSQVYKKLFMEEKMLRQKMTSQLEEYRKLQEERYKAERNSTDGKSHSLSTPGRNGVAFTSGSRSMNGTPGSLKSSWPKPAPSLQKVKPTCTESKVNHTPLNSAHVSEKTTPGKVAWSSRARETGLSQTPASCNVSSQNSKTFDPSHGKKNSTTVTSSRFYPPLHPSTDVKSEGSVDPFSSASPHRLSSSSTPSGYGDMKDSALTTKQTCSTSSSGFSKTSPTSPSVLFASGDKDTSLKLKEKSVFGLAAGKECNSKSKLFDSDDEDVSIIGVGDLVCDAGKDDLKGDAAVAGSQSQHVKGSSADDPQVLCNVTCGNCGQKGHNRTFVRCPNYFSAEEQARRDAKAAEQRRRAEERAREAEERLREEERALQRLVDTRQRLQQNKEQMMAQIAAATQQCASQFQQQLDQLDHLQHTKERKVNAQKKRQQKKKQ
nr:hypothetical protein BaRGS_017740 [Batillaria attramentaria]